MLKKRGKNGISIGLSFADVVRKTTTWYFVLAPLMLLYLGVALHVAWSVQPFSQLLGLPEKQAASLLLDLCIVMLPLIGAIAKYLSWLNKKEKAAREEFIAEFKACELVQAATNHNLVYKMLTKGPDESIGKMQIVWTPDGRCTNGAIYENRGVREFEAIRFLRG